MTSIDRSLPCLQCHFVANSDDDLLEHKLMEGHVHAPKPHERAAALMGHSDRALLEERIANAIKEAVAAERLETAYRLRELCNDLSNVSAQKRLDEVWGFATRLVKGPSCDCAKATGLRFDHETECRQAYSQRRTSS